MNEKRTIDDATPDEWVAEALRRAKGQSAGTVPDQVQTPGVAAVAGGLGSKRRDRWHHERNYYGHSQDATVEATASGTWRVTKTNIATGSQHVRTFRGQSARADAMAWAWMVNLPPMTDALL